MENTFESTLNWKYRKLADGRVFIIMLKHKETGHKYSNFLDDEILTNYKLTGRI